MSRPGEAIERDRAEARGGTPWLGIALSLLGSLSLLAAALAIPPLREAVGNALQGDTQAVRAELRSLGAGGLAIVFGLTIVHTVVWYPTEIVNTAAGFVFGFWPALALCLTGWVTSGVLGWLIGRSAARPVLYRLIGERRFRSAEELVERGGIPLLLAMRLLPIVPFALFSIAAGAARVPIWRFVWTSALGYLPLTALFVYFGSRLDELSLGDPTLWIGVVVLLSLLFAAHWLSPRKRRPKGESSPESTPERRKTAA
ncbi:MAG: VTT domain-containing protein [Solirubrobacterales bacterium]|nr:VTT domain-containing protein [Solirubrobacterales bacterium]